MGMAMKQPGFAEMGWKMMKIFSTEAKELEGSSIQLFRVEGQMFFRGTVTQ